MTNCTPRDATKRTRRAGVVGLSALLAFGSIPAVGTAPAFAEETQPTTTSVTTPIAVKAVTPEVPADAGGQPLGAITAVEQDGSVVTLTAQNGAMRVTFLDNRNFRMEADPSGTFTDPANTPQNDPARTANIVVGAETFDGGAVGVADGGIIALSTSEITLTIEKETGKTALKRKDGSVVWAEESPITFGGNSATQHLADFEGEQFIGGGMQNGRSVHTDATINIARNFDWDDDGYPNAVPYYMSSKGYGVLRNTFARGSYDFKNNTTTHEEKRFDAYYFVGDYKESLESYTLLTGRPMLPPVYALEYGDADCYNRSNPEYSSSGFGDPENTKQRTPQALNVAKQFRDYAMPAGWMLINDGYGCEYVELPETVQTIEAETGLKTGLWTQRSLTNQEFEVGEAGVRLRKLDVAWVGSGYRQALTGCESAYDGIEQFSDARGTSLMVEGWAGSQRCGMQWTGDHSGNLDAVRWQISALTGAGNSGLAFSTGDVDGIFGGSTESYVRDLQWKAFAPALYSMSGWAQKDKRPWLYGEEATEINRDYLELRQRLMPYIYTLAQESHATGVPMMRSMALEYPQDPNSYSAEANNQFLLGEDYLVAPVFTDTEIRNGIYLPAGEQWVDYWTGKIYQGGQVLNGIAAPLEQLPIFVRAGALVPQGITARNASLVPEDSPITLDVYPQGKSSFFLYEDEKVTREHQDGEFSTQELTVDAPQAGKKGQMTVSIGARKGMYDTMAAARPYVVKAHAVDEPQMVKVGSAKLTRHASQKALDEAGSGWYYDAGTAGGVVTVKTAPIASGAAAVIELKSSSAIGGGNADSFAAEVRVGVEKQVFQGETTTVSATFVNSGTKPKFDVVLTPVLPAGWEVVGSSRTEISKVGPGESATVEFVVMPSSSAAAGLQTIRVHADYKDVQKTKRSITAANQLEVAYGSLQGAFNSVSITDLDTAANGNFDGGGATFSAAALAEAGAVPGGTITAGEADAAINYTWPTPVGEPNSVQPAGQTVAVQGQGTHLAILGSAAAGSGANPELTLTYTDGTVQKANVFFPNWLPQASGLGGAEVAVRSLGRNNSNNPEVYEYPAYTYQVYSNLVRLNPGKELASVVLPSESRVRFFDWQVVEQPLPPAPEGSAFASELDWVSAANGYGVIGKDVVNKDSASSPDVPLRISYTDPATGQQPAYGKGLGVHALSKITYYVGGKCSSFTADVGLEAGFAGNVIFKVDGDGVNQYQSRTFTPGFAPEAVNVDLTGVQYVDLIVEAPGSINGAHGVWGDARFNCG